MNYKDKFKAQMKKAGINSLDDLKSDAEKKAFFKAVDKSHDAKNEELLAFAEEAINEFKLKDSDIEKLKQGVKQMPPIKGAKLGKPQKVKPADEDLEEEMKDLEPDAKEINAMVKDPHKSKEGNPKDDILAMWSKESVKADVKAKDGADMAKVQDKAEMMYDMTLKQYLKDFLMSVIIMLRRQSEVSSTSMRSIRCVPELTQVVSVTYQGLGYNMHYSN